MSNPERATSGLAFFTYDGTLTTDVSMVEQQKQDLSGNTSVQTFCNDAFNLAIGEDISAALFTDSEVSNTAINTMVYIGSKVLSEQQAFMSDSLQATLAQNIASNAYNMTLGKNNKIPILSYLESLAVSQTYAWDFRNKTLSNNQILDTIKNKAVLMTNIVQSDMLPSGVKLDGSTKYMDLGANTINVGEDFTFETLVKDTTIPSGPLTISGGNYTITEDGNYYVYSLTEDNLDYDVSVSKSFNADYLVVAGGGGGSSEEDYQNTSQNRYRKNGGGGGGGGVLEGNLSFDENKIYKIRVGKGGSRDVDGNNSYIQEDSVNIIECIGGGKGGSKYSSAGSGGCGGGGSESYESKGLGTSGQGFDGCDGRDYNNFSGKGGCGGGAGGAGNSNPSSGTAAGPGKQISGFEGNTIGVPALQPLNGYYAGGGGSNHPYGTAGGAGGGGSWPGTNNDDGNPGTANSGGGGAGSYAYASGGAGGSGICVIRYPV